MTTDHGPRVQRPRSEVQDPWRCSTAAAAGNPGSSWATSGTSPRRPPSSPSSARGCCRLSEIAGRLGKPATSLSRPLERLLGLGLIRRDVPFGASVRDTKRPLYRIADPLLGFGFRFVEPNRSHLEAGQVARVAREIGATLPHHVASVWEDLVRESVPRSRYFKRVWGEAWSWWGPGKDRSPLEIALVAESADRKALLIGEVQRSAKVDLGRLSSALRQKTGKFPPAHGRQVCHAIWTAAATPARSLGGVRWLGPEDILKVLR